MLYDKIVIYASDDDRIFVGSFSRDGISFFFLRTIEKTQIDKNKINT